MIEINNNLNKLKENLSYLASVCDENKYFEMKNLILVYELKFRNFKELKDEFVDVKDNQTEAEKNAKLEQCSGADCAVCKPHTPYGIRQRRSVYQQNLNYKTTETFVKPKPETNDKSTFTIHDISTQTELVDSNNNNNQTPKHNIYLDPNDHVYITKSLKTPTPESDGKKYLLEAYLRNNTEPILTGSSTSSSGPLVKNKKKVKCETTTTTTTRGESGIGTYNDDENESLHRNHDDSFTDYPENIKDASSENESCPNKFKKKERIFKKTKRSLSHREKTNEVNLISPVKIIIKPESDLTLKKSPKLVENKNITNNNIKPVLMKNKPNSSTSSSPNTATSTSVMRKICTFLCFVFSLLFLFFVYFFYVNFLNPSCCDYRRNYLFLNIS